MGKVLIWGASIHLYIDIPSLPSLPLSTYRLSLCISMSFVVSLVR